MTVPQIGLPTELFWHHARRREIPHPVTLRFAEVDGRVECVRIEIGYDLQLLGQQPPATRRHPSPITTSDLRIPVARLIDEARRAHKKDLLAIVAGQYDADARVTAKARRAAKGRLGSYAEEVAERKRAPGRPRYWDDLKLARIAKTYVEALAVTAAPTRAVAKEESVSRSQAAKLVALARAAKLLTPTKSKQKGGHLTTKAVTLLESADVPGRSRRRRHQ